MDVPGKSLPAQHRSAIESEATGSASSQYMVLLPRLSVTEST